MATNGDSSISKRRIGGMDVTVTADNALFYEERIRRERAFQWHARWAMPSYDRMIENVKKSPGLDITVEDVDLLPWGKDRRLNRKEYVAIQNGTSTRDTSKPIKDFEKRDEEDRKKREAERKAQEEERRLKEEEAERRRKAAEEAAQRLRDLEEAKRRREEEEERLRREQEERIRKEEEERLRRLEEERRRKEEEERRRREEEERRRREEEERRRQEEERRRLEEERRRLEEERRLREEEERRRREEEERRRREEEERRRREEEERLRREAEEAERRRLEEERRLAEEAERKRREAERERLRNEPPPITYGESAVERAYRTFDMLARPTRETMQAATAKTDGLDVVEDEVGILPWNDDGKGLDYAVLRDMFEREKRRREMEKKILELWRKYGKPNKEQFKAIVLELNCGITDDDISVLTWDEEDEYILEHEDDEEEKAKARRAAFQRRKIEEEERRRRLAEIEAAKRSPKKVRPPPIPLGDSPIERAYRWYSRLSGPKRDEFLRVVNRDSLDINEKDVDLLPWIKKGAILDFERLKEMLDIEEEKRKAKLFGNKKPKEKVKKNLDLEKRREKAYKWYKILKKPKQATMYRLVEETLGMDIMKADIDLLPWDAEGLVVKQDEI